MARTFFAPPRSGLVMDGSTARHVAFGSSKKPNSVRARLTEKPRTVSGRPGTAMMRVPLGITTLPLFISAPGASRSICWSTMASPNASTHSLHFSRLSSAWRSEGAAIIQSDRARCMASATTSAAVVKSLPVWRDHTPTLKRDWSSYQRRW
jgi:hypothetical protein